MTQEEDVVEKIYNMHFPSKEIECQTSLSWVSTMVNLDETLEKIEDNFETYADNDTNVDDKPAENINNEYAEDVISRTFHFGAFHSHRIHLLVYGIPPLRCTRYLCVIL